MTIVWSEQARRDLYAIREFIARDSEHYARLQVERLISRVERAGRMPSKGHPVHEGAYRIIYGISGEEFQVVTIVHMKQRVTRRRLR